MSDVLNRGDLDGWWAQIHMRVAHYFRLGNFSGRTMRSLCDKHVIVGGRCERDWKGPKCKTCQRLAAVLKSKGD